MSNADKGIAIQTHHCVVLLTLAASASLPPSRIGNRPDGTAAAADAGFARFDGGVLLGGGSGVPPPAITGGFALEPPLAGKALFGGGCSDVPGAAA